MRLYHLSVRNFRGIQRLDWVIPNERLVCLIGRGDSAKSTILEALRRVFYPHWNLSFDDSDFHLCRTELPINIDVVFGNLPESFLDFGKYGYCLRGWDAQTNTLKDEPGIELDEVLQVRLSVECDLEPKWTVIQDNNDDDITFKTKDRERVGVSLIRTFSDRDLTWATGSVLGQVTDTENINTSLADVVRNARAALEDRRQSALPNFDTVAKQAEETSRYMGVNVASGFKAHLDSDAISVKLGGLTLHDGDVPLRRLGLGSKRILITGLRKQVVSPPHITLFDEVEIGLEPHRIARLLRHLEADDTGQYILTTHSPVVLRELTVSDLHIVHCENGQVNVVAADKPELAENIQGNIRASAEAFLAPKIIICEGATEVGFLRGLDDYWTTSERRLSLAYCGVALFDAKGAGNIKGVTKVLQSLGYKLAVFADSDNENHFSDEDAKELRDVEITVVKWDDGTCLEERVIQDLSWGGVVSSLHAAKHHVGGEDILVRHVEEQIGCTMSPKFEQWRDSPSLRTSIGRVAKKKSWFKRQDKSQDWVTAISQFLTEDAIGDSDLFQKLATLREWIDGE